MPTGESNFVWKLVKVPQNTKYDNLKDVMFPSQAETPVIPDALQTSRQEVERRSLSRASTSAVTNNLLSTEDILQVLDFLLRRTPDDDSDKTHRPFSHGVK